MRVLQVITTLGIGGAELFLLDLVRGLARAGARCEVIYLKGRGELSARFEAAGAPVRRIELSHLGRARRVAAQIDAHRRAGGFQLVHSHLLKANLCAEWGRGETAHLRSQHNDERILRRAHAAWAYRRLFRRAGLLSVPTAWVGRFLEGVGEPRARIRVIPYGLELPSEEEEVRWRAAGRALRRQLGCGAGEFLVLVLGRLAEQKGQLALVRSLSAHAPPGGLRLLFVGGDPSGRAERRLRSAVRRSPWRDAITLAPATDQPQVALRAADCLLVPSLWEGFGRVALEGMIAARPVLAHRLAALEEVLAEVGLFARVGCAQEILDALLELRDDPARRRSLGAAGRERARECFSYPRMVTSYLQLYEQILAGARR